MNPFPLLASPLRSSVRNQSSALRWLGVIVFASLHATVCAAPELSVEQPAGEPVSGKVVGWGWNHSGQLNIPGSLSRVRAISAGARHTVALRTDGTLAAWGDTAFGTISIPGGLTPVMAVAAAEHTLAVRSNGTVAAWGMASGGATAVPAGLTGVTRVAAGDDFSAALKSDGTVVAWGANRTWGGIGGWVETNQAAVPAGLTGVTAIAAGYNHMLALKSDGTVAAWGANFYGESVVPPGLNGVVAISAGSGWSLALRSDGTLLAWGENSYGQTTTPAGLGDVVAISAGGAHGLALRRTGAVVAWGANNNGETNVPSGLRAVESVSAGASHSLALQRTVDFGARRTGSPGPARTFAVRNTGTSPLVITGISRSGGNDADFVLNTAGMVTNVPAGGSTSCSVIFNPGEVGVRRTFLHIECNDSDEAVYEVELTGTGLAVAPEIAVTGNGLSINDGDVSPVPADGTDFGTHAVGSPAIVRTFTISNPGVDPLHLTGSPTVALSEGQAADFSITTPPGTTIAPGANTTFTIAFQASGAGQRAAHVSIPSDAFDPAVFDFLIQGTGMATVPVMTAPAVTGITANAATLGGTVSSAGGVTLITRGVVIAPTAVNSDPVIGGTGVISANSAGGVGAFTAEVSDLLPGTAYTFKAFGVNSVGIAYSAAAAFTTLPPAVPAVSAPASSGITYTGAHLAATVTDTGGLAITARGIVIAPAAVNTDPLIGGAGVTQISSDGTVGTMFAFAGALTPGTAYVFKGYATNSFGTGYSEPRNFSTLVPSAPAVSGAASSQVTSISAWLQGSITSENGAAVTARGFVYALTAVNPDPLPGGAGVTIVAAPGVSASFNAEVSGLIPSSSYSFKAWATNLSGTGYSAAGVFTTLPPAPPVVTSPAASNVTAGSATPGGNVLSERGSGVIERGIVIAPVNVNARPFIGGAGVSKVTADGTLGVFTADAGSLTAGTTYVFKAFAVSNAGVGYSDASVFTTPGGPPAARLVTTAVDEFDTPSGTMVSLREAVRDAADGDAIGFAVGLDGQVLAFTRGEIGVTGKSVHIDASLLLRGIVLDGMKSSRLFKVAGGASLTLTKVTLQRGQSSGADASAGGAILSSGTLTLTDCTLRDNAAADGRTGTTGYNGGPSFSAGVGGQGYPGANGGAISSTGSLTVLRSRFLSNRAGEGGPGGNGGNSVYGPSGCGGFGGSGGNGGAIDSTGILTLEDCQFEGNAAGGGGSGGSKGSGITGYCESGGLLSPSGGASGDGGAVRHLGSFTATGCTFLRNACRTGGFGGYLTDGGLYASGGKAGAGGAIACGGGAALLTNCTVSGNSIQDGYGFGADPGGAGIYCTGAPSSTLHLVHCTITGNEGNAERLGISGWNAGEGGGIFSHSPLQCDNCLIAGNRIQRGGTASDWREENLAGSGARTFAPATPFPDYPAAPVAALLSPASVSGGSLPLHVLLSGSPALNGGVALTGAPSLDQRGLPRPVNAPDLGAVELQTSEPGSLPPQSLTFDPPVTLQFNGAPLTLNLSATTSAGLPAVLELLSGPATLAGTALTITASGSVTVRASHSGTFARASAPEITRSILVSDARFDDPDHDGLTNIIETALQTSLTEHTGPPLIIEARPDGTLHAVLARRPSSPGGWQIDIQTSPDLVNWTTAPAAVTTVTPGGVGFDKVDVLLPGGTATEQFVRLRVVSPE